MPANLCFWPATCAQVKNSNDGPTTKAYHRLNFTTGLLITHLICTLRYRSIYIYIHIHIYRDMNPESICILYILDLYIYIYVITPTSMKPNSLMWVKNQLLSIFLPLFGTQRFCSDVVLRSKWRSNRPSAGRGPLRPSGSSWRPVRVPLEKLFYLFWGVTTKMP